MKIETACRACGAEELEVVLSLGSLPLANSLLYESDLAKPEPTYPLDFAFCPRCALAQITATVDPEVLFAGEYVYLSSFSDTALANAKEIAERMQAELGLGVAHRVVELASNDGYLLQHYLALGVPVLGIEPAENAAEVARERHGIECLNTFFSEELAAELAAEGPIADVVHANNVLAHVADLRGFVRGIRTILRPAGRAVLEVPYLGELIERLEFDTIYHEHLCYFSLTALQGLFEREGLTLLDVEQIPIHGGSLRVFVGHEGGPSARVGELLRAEREHGLHSLERFADLGARVADLRVRLLAFMDELKASGQRVAAYGAAAKGATLLCYAGLGRETFDYVVDRSSVKQGRLMPGSHLPIEAPERLLEDQPDCVLLLAWNFAEEIAAQQAEYLRRGGRFVVPVPEPHFLETD